MKLKNIELNLENKNNNCTFAEKSNTTMRQAILLHQNITSAILQACYIVHNELGCGFLEKVYQEALAVVLTEMNIPFEREKLLPITFHGHTLQCGYVADFLVAGAVIVELKAVADMSTLYEAQTINYLKASNIKVALLINFGSTKLYVKRIVNG